MKRHILLPLSCALLAACTTIPNGPSTYALPGTGKSFERFRYDDGDCRQYAVSQNGGTSANDAAINSGVASAVLGTAIGAVAGAAIGGQGGAAVGAGTGLAVGALAGAGAGQASGYNLQQRYDMAYGQCMYAKGHKNPRVGFVCGRNPAAAGSPAACTGICAPAASPTAARLSVKALAIFIAVAASGGGMQTAGAQSQSSGVARPAGHHQRAHPPAEMRDSASQTINPHLGPRWPNGELRDGASQIINPQLQTQTQRSRSPAQGISKRPAPTAGQAQSNADGRQDDWWQDDRNKDRR